MRRRLALLALPLLFGCGGDTEATTANLRPVTLERVRLHALEDRIEATGQLIPHEQAEISAEVTGRISEILVDEGEAVEVGSVVIAIDPEKRELERDRARAQLDEARATLREQKREYDRVKELQERSVASQTQLDGAATKLSLARSRVEAAQADLGVLERALRDAAVAAPFTGFIGRRFVSRGEFVSPGQKLFELVAIDPIEVEFHVTEQESGRVALGQKVSVRVAPHPDVVFPATVSVVSPTIDERSRTLRLKAEIDNSDGRLRPGLFARVDLGIATRQDVAMVPEEAVLQRADGAVIFVADEGNRVERRVVETGVHRDGSVEVSTGLRADELVVTRGHANLADGEIVEPRTRDGEPIGEAIPHVATQ